jgi:hypothetical protein
MHSKNIGSVLYIISALVVTKEEVKSSITESLIFTEIQSQYYMKGRLESAKDWLISKTSQDYYSQQFSGESYYEACVDNFKIAKHEVTLGLYSHYAIESSITMVGEAGCYVVGENNPTAD